VVERVPRFEKRVDFALTRHPLQKLPPLPLAGIVSQLGLLEKKIVAAAHGGEGLGYDAP
jgi:hypothetical protein